jgi:hypothetical protein
VRPYPCPCRRHCRHGGAVRAPGGCRCLPVPARGCWRGLCCRPAASLPCPGGNGSCSRALAPGSAPTRSPGGAHGVAVPYGCGGGPACAPSSSGAPPHPGPPPEHPKPCEGVARGARGGGGRGLGGGGSAEPEPQAGRPAEGLPPTSCTAPHTPRTAPCPTHPHTGRQGATPLLRALRSSAPWVLIPTSPSSRGAPPRQPTTWRRLGDDTRAGAIIVARGHPHVVHVGPQPADHLQLHGGSRLGGQGWARVRRRRGCAGGGRRGARWWPSASSSTSGRWWVGRAGGVGPGSMSALGSDRP